MYMHARARACVCAHARATGRHSNLLHGKPDPLPDGYSPLWAGDRGLRPVPLPHPGPPLPKTQVQAFTSLPAMKKVFLLKSDSPALTR